MASIVAIGEPVNDAERAAIAYLRDHLPNAYTVFHNFEIPRGGEFYEIDIAVLAPHALYLIDVKGTRGLIDVYGSKWYPQGRQPFTSPLAKLRSHARVIKGLLVDSQPGRRDLDGVYVDAVVLLTSSDAHLVDQSGRDISSVSTLKNFASFLKDTGRIPARFDKNISRAYKMVESALVGAARKRSGPVVLGNWEVLERLGGTDACTEYRAVNVFAGKRGGTALLRVYRADPYLTAPEEREKQRSRIANAFYALSRLPGHPYIAGAKSFFATEGEEQFVLVTEDVQGQALRLHIGKSQLALTLDQKIVIAREVLEALAFCHSQEVIHRNLTPGTVMLASDGHIRLTGFDHARAGSERSQTIAPDIVDEVDSNYSAPEAWRDPASASSSSDIFAAGLVLYELFAGQRPFRSPTELFDQAGVFAVQPSTQRAELTEAIDTWLQHLCSFEPAQRPTAQMAIAELDVALNPTADVESVSLSQAPIGIPKVSTPEPAAVDLDWANLPRGTLLGGKLEVQKRLGKGTFGVVYKVVDTLGDVTRALKLILRDRHSTLERLKKEYRTLVHLPEHAHVVRVIDANVLPGNGPPYMLFEFVDGEDLGDLIESARFAPEDALLLLKQIAEGLAHLHREGVYHCDIKPHNLLWTVKGAKIIDFNVSVRTEEDRHGGGSRMYIPPDLDLTVPPTPTELVDRDIYALGLTVYEAITGTYPWPSTSPVPATPAPDPREFPGVTDLSPDFVALVLKAIAPQRADRFASATALLAALSKVSRARREPTTETSETLFVPELDSNPPINSNPFVNYLSTLYSQSSKSNAGTRGLDELGRRTYVRTLLDKSLIPEVLAGKFKLVIITGNAGDGKTAFLQQLETQAGEQAQLVTSEPLSNGRRFTTTRRTFVTNYDGSQDEDNRENNAVLCDFFAPFAGPWISWADTETRLIAINEGRLVDFLHSERAQFPDLLRVIETVLRSGADSHGIAVINLNLRSIVASNSGTESLLERQLQLLTHQKFWQACENCDLKDRCYARHNAQTFQDKTAGPQVLGRLKTLYTLTHLRARLHITLRDLRSALAFTLTSARTCDEIHGIYSKGLRQQISASFYFNSWMGAYTETVDRLLVLLRDMDIGAVADPQLDRALDFVAPTRDASHFGFADRGEYDLEVLGAIHANLPIDFSGQPTEQRKSAHREFVSTARRRSFFERRDDRWQMMLPYRTANRMLKLISEGAMMGLAQREIIQAINRGEGLTDSIGLCDNLALQVRQVDSGTIKSYRLFDSKNIRLLVHEAASRARFVEHMPDALALRFDNGNLTAELVLNLDVFEMLDRLNRGYRPTPEEEQGYYLSLSVFKNVLGSAPYQELLLTKTGHEFYRIERQTDGRLQMTKLCSSKANENDEGFV